VVNRPLITADKMARTVTIHLDQIREVPKAQVSMSDAVDHTMRLTENTVRIMCGLPATIRYVEEPTHG
jgi:hypothetical protein